VQADISGQVARRSYCPYPSTAFEIVEAVLCRLRLGEQERRTRGKHSVARHDPPRAKGLPPRKVSNKMIQPLLPLRVPGIIHRILPSLSLIFDRRSSAAGRFIEYEAAKHRADASTRLCNLGGPFSFPSMRSRRERTSRLFPLLEKRISGYRARQRTRDHSNDRAIFRVKRHETLDAGSRRQQAK